MSILRPVFFRSQRLEVELAGEWTPVECRLGFIGILEPISGMSVSLPHLNSLFQKLAKYASQRSWSSRHEFWMWTVAKSQAWAVAQNCQLGRLELIFANEKWTGQLNQLQQPSVFKRRRVVCALPEGGKISGWFEGQFNNQFKNQFRVIPKEFAGTPKDLVNQFKGSFTEFTSRRMWISLNDSE